MGRPTGDDRAPAAGPPVAPVHREQGRTGGARRALLAGALVVTFVALALVKPWEIAAPRDADRPPIAVTAPSASASASRPVTPVPATVGPVSTPALQPAIAEPRALPPSPSTEALASVLVPRAEWGVRAVVFAPAAGTASAGTDAVLAERWIAADIDRAVGTVNATPAFAGDAVVALGVTVPEGVTPRSVRVWRILEMELPQRVAVLPAGPAPVLDGLWRAGSAATGLDTWPRGVFRFDVLLDDRIVRILTRVPTGGPVVLRSEPQPMGPRPDVVAALAGGRSGLFAVVGPAVVTIPSIAGDPLDERGAWTATCPGATGACRVPTLASRTTSGLGVVLEPGEVPASAVLTQLGPVPDAPRMVAETIALPPGASRRAGLTAVILRVDSPGPLSSGLYRLTVAWRTAEGAEREASWHLEIAPPGA